MDLTTFIAKRRPGWKRLEALLARVEGSGLRTLTEDEAVEFSRLYRSASSDLNQAQTFPTGDTTLQYLNDLVARCYLVIYADMRVDVWGALRHFFWSYPAVFRRYFAYFLVSAAVFAGGAAFGYLASSYEPDSRGFLLPRNFPTITPDGEGAEDNAPAQGTGELAGFGAFLFRNNMSVTLVAFALGLTFGIGTAWMMFYNGLMTGALAAIFVEAHQFTAFCTGVLPHGVLEIPAAVLGGAAGFLVAHGMVRARPWPRSQELARTAKQALLFVSGSLPLLIMAALLESVVARAPRWLLGDAFKLTVAAVFGTLFVAYLVLLGWRLPRAHPLQRVGFPTTGGPHAAT
jgi:uncharacterized membrane protein SpoIIM required for sporulation